jgi:molybdenum cofactor cytidylyltransferase
VKLALVVLAAGASARLGQCKALALLGGRSVLARLLEAGGGIGDVPPLVVTGSDHPSISRAAPRGCELLFNPEWERGRAGGVLLAHERWPDHALCLAPVDVPLVPASVFTALARKWDELGAPPSGWLAPRLRLAGDPLHGHFGHPVVAGPRLLARLADLAPEADLRSLRRLSDPLCQLAVETAAILDDLDLPSDLERLQRRFGAP